MNPFAMAAANVRSMWRRFIGLTVLLAVAAAVCVTALGISDRADSAARDRVQEGTANRSVTVDRLMERTDSKPLSTETVRTLSALPNVTSVEPRAQVSFGYKDQQVPGVLLYATTPRPSLLPPLLKSVRTQLFPLHPGEVVLPKRAQGSDLTPLLGHSITVTTTRSTSAGQGTGVPASVRVVGLFDPAWQLDGPDAAYADEATVVRWAAAKAGVTESEFTTSVGYDRITVLARTARDVPGLLSDIQSAGYAATSLQQEMSALPGVLSLIHTAGQVLLVVLGLVALVGALVVTGALSRQRAREIGILKALGFGNRAVLTMFVAETGIIGATGAVLGALLGLAGAAAAAAGLRGSSELAPYLPAGIPLPDPGVLAGILLLTLAVTVIGAWVPARRAAQLSPSDAIKEW
ncbi:ABC transporter permease [Streptomyces sp. NBC_01788]|uniref:ABC transporter permease n=1 Tax=Streptomyces sp. NBC_01788 TaxID=2975940 RepID=UPI002DD81B06|nr:ABC transporter permease [Streptomyces sp. NBC_01788]WSB27532.1 ABC transporter permease [Streptomyces sp. NBC_01788]